MTDQPRRSPLHDRHVALGAKFAEFGGWEMPLEYARGGVLAEHTAVREAVGVFDVSHLGKARVTGPGAVAFLNGCLTADLDRIGAGNAQYTLLCDEATGGVVDDLIAYRHADDHVFLVPNAANTAEVVRRLSAAAAAWSGAGSPRARPAAGDSQAPDLARGVTVANEHDAYAVIAVQGPASERVMDSLGLPADHDYMTFVTAYYGPAEVVVCRTGYTGEHGYELVVPAGQAAPVWDALFAAGEPYSVRACGLAARDTLRTEMGYPLHGQDLSPSITPVQARCGWAVGWSKPAFWGHEALRAERAEGPRRQAWGLLAKERGIPRPHMPVLIDDAVVGEVTSGTFSPTAQAGIALALLDTAAGLDAGAEVAVDVRGRRLPMRLVKPPFVTPSVR